MITPFQNSLRQCLENQELIRATAKQGFFSGKTLSKAENELENFILGNCEYSNISDTALLDRFCKVFKINHPEQRSIRNQLIESDYQNNESTKNSQTLQDCAQDLTKQIETYFNENKILTIEFEEENTTRAQPILETEIELVFPSNEDTNNSSIESLPPQTLKAPLTENEIHAKELIIQARNSKAKRINLSGLGLKKLPEEMECLRHNLSDVQHIDLSNNNLSDLPEAFIFRSESIKTLNLNSNQFTHFPKALKLGSKNLTVMIEENPLTEIDDYILERIETGDYIIKASSPIKENIAAFLKHMEDREKQKVLELEAEERLKRSTCNHLKLLKKEAFETLQNKTLKSLNALSSKKYSSLPNLFNAKPQEKIVKMISNNFKLMEMLIASMYLSEPFHDKTLKEIGEYLGIDRAELLACLRHPTKLVKTQEDLDKIFRNLSYYSEDIIRKNKKLTGYEDPNIKFLSAGEFNLHSKDPMMQANVKKKLEELKAMTQRDDPYA